MVSIKSFLLKMKVTQNNVMKVTIFLILLCHENTVCSLEVDSDKSCSRGQSCVVKNECPAVQKLYRVKESEGLTKREKSSLIRQLRSLICNEKQRGFCCKIEPQYECGKVDQGTEFIFGGKQTFAGEFPFTALIGAKKGKWSQWFCSGALINSKYVLTAAHCLEQIKETQETVVRLGELVVHQSRDCSGDSCLEEPQDFTVTRSNLIPHPDFERLAQNIINDIGLIRLPRPAEFNRGVIPACLPEPNQSLAGVRGTIVGWGFTSAKRQSFKILDKNGLNSLHEIPETHQQKAELTVMENSKCEFWDDYLTGGLRPSQLCAGDTTAQACRGDSGGPLLTQEGASGGLTSTWTLIGLVSFGSRHCGGEVPSVLTRVTSYLDWIAEHTRDVKTK